MIDQVISSLIHILHEVWLVAVWFGFFGCQKRHQDITIHLATLPWGATYQTLGGGFVRVSHLVLFLRSISPKMFLILSLKFYPFLLISDVIPLLGHPAFLEFKAVSSIEHA